MKLGAKTKKAHTKNKHSLDTTEEHEAHQITTKVLLPSTRIAATFVYTNILWGHYLVQRKRAGGQRFDGCSPNCTYLEQLTAAGSKSNGAKKCKQYTIVLDVLLVPLD
jgi:hypothetical protein